MHMGLSFVLYLLPFLSIDGNGCLCTENMFFLDAVTSQTAFARYCKCDEDDANNFISNKPPNLEWECQSVALFPLLS